MKPRQVLRACWSGLQKGFKILFRILGLSIIMAGLRSLRNLSIGKGFDEPTKVAIHQSRSIACLRALIHIAPLGVALWEIILNWNTYFVGATIRNIAYYQFGAKIHEMAAQASLAAVVFTYIRYELSLGQGLPFGALFSALHISQASYLWSMEFWGTACSKHLPIRRRVGVVLTIITAILLAATIGPSSAILLIPRLAYWPAGSTDIWLNATSQDIWPDRTDGSLVSTDCLSWDPVTYDVDCPSSGWQAIQETMDLTARSIPRNDAVYYGAEIPAAVEITGRSSLRQLTSLIATTDEGSPMFTSWIATSQQVAVADALTTTGILWGIAMSNTSTKGHGSVLNQLDAVHSITTDYYQPYTSVVCYYDTIRGPSDTAPVVFPTYSSLGVQAVKALASGNFTRAGLTVFQNLTKLDIFNTVGGLGEYRLRWVELPFNDTAIGAVILKPQSRQNSTQEILMCSVGAGWGSSKMNTSIASGSATPVRSEVSVEEIDKALRSYNLTISPDWSGGILSQAEERAMDQGNTFFSPIFPQRPLIITEKWASYLNPSIKYLNTTVFNNLMGLFSGSGSITHQTDNAEVILAEMVANGLSRIASTSQLQGTVKQTIESDQSVGLDGNYWFAGKGNNVFQVDPQESKDWVKFRVSTTVEGYAYNTHGRITKLAIGVLLAYCLVAITHIIYAGISGISSTCWDSISEVTALAMNSTPTVLLRNTCAGISELNIFKLPVRVLAFADAEGDGEHLELVFGNTDEKTIGNKTIKPNRVYGTMPVVKAHEKVA